MTVSLIITTYNWSEALNVVLKSVLKQSRLPDEVIVADDGSGIATAECIEEIGETTSVPIHHVWQEDKGFRAASARNKAIRASNCDYLVLIDGDMLLHEKFIEDHLACAQKDTFMQGSRVLLTEEKTADVLSLPENVFRFSFFEKGLKNRKNTIYSRVLCKLFSKQKKGIRGIKTCNFALYREDAYRVNGFNECFVGWGREDSEFVVRLMNAGIARKDVKFSAIAYHLYHRENTRDSLPLNDKMLQEAILEKKRWCTKGLQ